MSGSDIERARIELEDGHVDLETGRVDRKHAPSTLTTMEIRALKWFVAHRGEDVSHEDLLQEVWDYAPGVVSRAPYFTVRRLRAKLERDPDSPEILQTVHGVGYRFLGRRSGPPRSTSVGNLSELQPTLFGREAVSIALSDQLSSSRRLSLFGPPGVGKTALASTTAARRGGETWQCSLDEGVDVTGAASAVAALLDRRPSDGDPIEAIQAVPRMLADRGPVQLILDDAHPDVVDALCRAWLPRVPELRIIGTHRRRPAGASAILVPPLGPVDGAALLRESTLKLGRTLSDDAEAALQSISERLDGIPLALVLVAPRLLVMSPSRLATTSEIPADANLEATIKQAWQQLSLPSKDVLAMCGAFAHSATLFGLVSLTPHSEASVLDALQDLTDRCLVKIHDPLPPLDEPRFSTFASVRGFLKRQEGHTGRQEQARAHVAERCWELRKALEDGAPSAYAELVSEAANLDDALMSARAELRARLARDLILRSSGTPQDRWNNAERAVALAEAEGETPWLAEAFLLRAVAGRGTLLGDPQDYQRAASAADPPTQRLRIALGEAQYHLVKGDLKAAEPHLDEAWIQACQAKVPGLSHAVLQSRLHASAYRSDLETSRDLVEQILALRRSHALEHLPHQNLAVWYDMTGDTQRMFEVLEADIENHQRRGECDREANAWMNRGYLYMKSLSPLALQALETAVRLSQRSGNRAIESTSRYNLSSLYLTLWRFTEANAEALAALALSESLHNHRGRAMCKLGLAHIATARRDPNVAALLEEARDLAVQSGDPKTTILAQMLLAPVLFEDGDTDRAEQVWHTVEQTPLSKSHSKRLQEARDVHRAFYRFCRGDPTAVDTLLDVPEDTNALRILRTWVRPRR